MDKKKVLKVIENIVFYGLLFSFILILGNMLKAKSSGVQPSILGNKFFIVLTGSMSPTIEVGDLIVVKDTNAEDIQVNDVITFGSKSSGNITTHRVKEVLNSGQEIQYVTQGDANNVEDPTPVESEVLLGRVNKVIPKVGAIMLWIQKNIMDILISIIAIIIGSVLFTKLKEKVNKGKDATTEERLD